MKKMIVANWKMNPRTERGAIALARASDFPGVVVAPPFPFLESVKKVLRKASLGAQDVFFENPFPGGAYTGEVSAAMLKKLGVSYVIVGHSERRNLGETEAVVAKKVKAVLAEKMRVILCIGEHKQVRARGMGAVLSFIDGQLKRGLAGVASRRNVVVAYEPIWAIGSGKNDRPEDTEMIARAIREKWGVQVLYGGSVNSKNIFAFLKIGSIDGVLVGGASLKQAEFRKLVKKSGIV